MVNIINEAIQFYELGRLMNVGFVKANLVY